MPELLIILVVIVIIFGVGRLPEIGGALGRGIREFRHASKDDGDDTKQLHSETKETPANPEQSERGGTVQH